MNKEDSFDHMINGIKSKLWTILSLNNILFEM